MNKFYAIDLVTTIPENSNLNDYGSIGNYMSPNAEITGTLANCPFTGAGFVLHVERTTGGSTNGYCKQRMITNGYAPIEYWRTKCNNEWGYWKKIEGNPIAI